MGLSSVDNVTIEINGVDVPTYLLMVLKIDHIIYLQMKRLMRLML